MPTARLASLAAVLVTLLAVAQRADAVVIAKEGTEIVVRPDPGEPLTDFDVIANPDRDGFDMHKFPMAGDEVNAHAGPGCEGRDSLCNIAGATALRLELGSGDQEVLV